MTAKGFNPEDYDITDNILKFSWNPVKINSKGTMEYRGGDINYMSVVLAVSVMLKFALRKIQQDFLLVVPTDMDMKDAFKTEENVMFIPPHTMVRKHLQPASAYEGYSNKQLYTYSKAFFSFIRKEVYKEYRKLLKPVKVMLDKKESVSDSILKKVKRKGFSDKLTQDYANELALFYSNKYKKDIYKLYDVLLKLDD